MEIARKRRPTRQQRLFQAWVVRLIADGDWQINAACRSADPELFFPVSSAGMSLEQVAEAKMICSRCLVRRECPAFAMRTQQVHGIWGGLPEQERYQTTETGHRTARPGGVKDLAHGSAAPRRDEHTGICHD